MPSFRAMPISLLLLACCALLAPAGVLRAQVRRCTMPDGTTVFTDRRCTDLGATERKPEPPAPLPSAGGGARFYRGCARNLQDLAYELTTALDDHDVNRLAGVVDWVGMDPWTLEDAEVRSTQATCGAIKPLLKTGPPQG